MLLLRLCLCILIAFAVYSHDLVYVEAKDANVRYGVLSQHYDALVMSFLSAVSMMKLLFYYHYPISVTPFICLID